MKGCWLPALLLLAFSSDVRALTCIDCGPLNLPTATCNQNKECYTGYCTYYNKTVQNRVELNFRCGSDQLNGPGGSVFSEINRCVVVQEGDTWYRMKICNDRDLCNAECNSSPRSAPAFVSAFLISAALFWARRGQ